MRYFLALAAVAAFSLQASAASLPGQIILSQENVETFDPGTFAPGPNVDVYSVLISNPNSIAAGALQLEFFGDLVNRNSSPLAFKDNGSLPTLGPNTVADSFFVIPAGSSDALLPAPGQTRDGEGVLAAQFTLAGAPRLILGESENTLMAVMSVMAGSEAPTPGLNRAEIDGAFEEITFAPIIPEPATALLAGLALVGVAARRRK